MLISISSVLLDVILTLAFIWLVVLIIAIITLSRRRDMPTPVKIFWAALIFFAPFVGLVLYIVFGVRKNNRNSNRY